MGSECLFPSTVVCFVAALSGFMVGRIKFQSLSFRGPGKGALQEQERSCEESGAVAGT